MVEGNKRGFGDLDDDEEDIFSSKKVPLSTSSGAIFFFLLSFFLWFKTIWWFLMLLSNCASSKLTMFFAVIRHREACAIVCGKMVGNFVSRRCLPCYNALVLFCGTDRQLGMFGICFEKCDCLRIRVISSIRVWRTSTRLLKNNGEFVRFTHMWITSCFFYAC